MTSPFKRTWLWPSNAGASNSMCLLVLTKTTFCQYFTYQLSLLFSSMQHRTFDCNWQLLCSIFLGRVWNTVNLYACMNLKAHITMLS
jgi:hypothetical protein